MSRDLDLSDGSGYLTNEGLDLGKVDNNALKFGTLWNGWNALERLERFGTIWNDKRNLPGCPNKDRRFTKTRNAVTYLFTGITNFVTQCIHFFF